MPNRLLALILILAAQVFSYAQGQLHLRNIGAAEGIPNNMVATAYQDEFGMMWIGTQDGLIRYDGTSMEIFRPEEGNPNSIYNNNIKAICGDRKGSVYVISKFALCRFDIRSERFETIYEKGIQSIFHDGNDLLVALGHKVLKLKDGKLEDYLDLGDYGNHVFEIFRASDGILYVGNDNGIYSVDSNGKVSQEYRNTRVISFFEDSRRNIWAGTREHGVLICSPTGKWRSLDHEHNGISSNFVRSVCEDEFGNIFIGSLGGLDVYFPSEQKIVELSQQKKVEQMSVYKIIRDDQNTLWICTKGGIFLYNREQIFYTSHDEVFFDDRTLIIKDMVENDSHYFFGTEENGLVRVSKSNLKAEFYPSRTGLSSLNITGLYMEPDGNTLWVGTMLGEMNRVDLRTGAVRVYSKPSDYVSDICPYGEKLILACRRNVYSMDKKTGAFELISTSPYIKGLHPTCIYIDKDDNCWIAVSEGLFRQNLRTGEEKAYFFEDKSVLGTSRVHVAKQDSMGRLWFGTTGSGLLLYHPETDSFSSYTTGNSLLANNYIWSIEESRSGYILLTDNSGFARFDPENELFYNYTSEHGFPIMFFSTNGIYVARSGEIYVSGYKSLISFRENRLPDYVAPSRLYFNALETDGEYESLLYADRIDLRGGNTSFSLKTATPDFLYSNGVEYKLEGLDDGWNKSRIGERIVYSNLAPGSYRLVARCVEPVTGTVSALSTLDIRVHPKWFWSNAAKIIYLILLLTTLFTMMHFYMSRVRLTASLNYEKREKERIQETNQSKLQFFTYVSHELRTPVTLIQSQVNSLLAKNNIPPFIYNRILGINRNLGKINSLLGELRDFRKQEQGGKIHLLFTHQDIIPQLERISLVFSEYAQSSGIEFAFENDCACTSGDTGTTSADADTTIWYDPDQMEKVVYNLISNALKNTPKGGSVKLKASIGDDCVKISVSDTGRGIPKQYLESIFDPFFQVPGNPSGEQGTGLGLAITKGIVDAHGGRISCQSIENVGSTFTVSLPLGDSHVPEEQKTAGNEAPSPSEKEELPVLDEKFIEGVLKTRGDIQPSILIVEDNDELRDYLGTLFAPIYSVTLAKDGLDAWEKLEHNVPDLILSDLMMPGMDGNELCAKVKNNFYTSHVPVVILTAKVAEESILESLRSSADDYIVKPFNAKILISKCNNLVNTRLALQRKYASSSLGEPDLVATNEIDRDFIEKATRIVRENLTDPAFDVTKFATEMALGRTRLFDKLKGVVGQTPNKFIMTIRLKYARELLSGPEDISVNEVSYMTGFSSPSYFIKTFKSCYGITPSAFKASTQSSQA